MWTLDCAFWNKSNNRWEYNLLLCYFLQHWYYVQLRFVCPFDIFDSCSITYLLYNSILSVLKEFLLLKYKTRSWIDKSNTCLLAFKYIQSSGIKWNGNKSKLSNSCYFYRDTKWSGNVIMNVLLYTIYLSQWITLLLLAINNYLR